MPCPVACPPQSWSSGALFQFVRTLLALWIDARENVVTFEDPVLPESLDGMQIRGLGVPGGSLDFSAVHARASCAVEILSKPAALGVRK